MYILGIACHYHDASAALLKDGRLVAASEEERFTRVKHDNSFPSKAIEFCLSYAGMGWNDISYVAFYENPIAKFDRIVQTFVETWPSGFVSFWKAIPSWLGEKLSIEKEIRKLGYKGKIVYCDHHMSHAASAFFVSPFERAAIMTIDGVGEWTTASLKIGEGNRITPLKEIVFPHSLGLLYSTITAYLGFQVNNDEYKMMGLSAYGKPEYYDAFKKIIDVKDDGSFRLDMKYFDYRSKSRMWSRELERLLGEPRRPGEEFAQRHKDIAASVQKITEEIYFKIANHLYELTKLGSLCIAGGVGLNCVANGKLYTQTPFKRVFVQPNAGDGGGSLGAAYFVWNQMLNNPRSFEMRHAYYGSEFGNDYIKAFLDGLGAKYEYMEDAELVKRVAALLADNKVVGWFRGRLEWGPRALGSRSILANPAPKWMKERVNEIKMREQFRPFAGSVMQERVQECFETPEENHYSPFMVFAFRVKDDRRDSVVAITHEDGTCRIQTVNKDDNGIYYDVISEFHRLTGTPVVLNTSFNLKKEPIVRTPEQAYDDFAKTGMDCLVLGNYFLAKPERQQPPAAGSG